MVKRNAAVNADGFGMGWYNDGVSEDPVIFTSISPAEHNVNLSRIAGKTRSRIVFGHARAASPGSAIHEMNCHPFQFGRFVFMHNGGIANFRVLRRPLQNMLSQSSFNMIAGTTDSELAGALFVDQLPDRNPYVAHPPQAVTAALRRTIHLIHDLAQQYGDPSNPATKISSLNFAVSDGRTTVCSRFRDSTIEEPPSLYYCQYTKHARVEGESEFYYESDRPVLGVLVGSEPLNYNASIWHLVPKNHLITITHNNNNNNNNNHNNEEEEDKEEMEEMDKKDSSLQHLTAFIMEPVFDVHTTVRKVLARWKSLTFNKKRFHYTSPSASNSSTTASFSSSSSSTTVPPTPDLAHLIASPSMNGNTAADGHLTIQSLLATTSPEQLKNLFEQLQRLPLLSPPPPIHSTSTPLTPSPSSTPSPQLEPRVPSSPPTSCGFNALND